MYDQYKNIFLSNFMNGATPHSKCDCGHDGSRQLLSCPDCGALRCNHNDDLAFNNIPFGRTVCKMVEDPNKLYSFHIVFVKVAGNYKINFSKKKIGSYTVKKQYVYVVNFDSHKPADEMVTFYDVMEQKYLTEQEFISKGSEHGSFSIVDISDIKNKDVKCTIFDYNYDKKISKKLINSLNSLIHFCSTPHNEILIKAGIDPKKILVHEINRSGTTPMEILGIKKYTFRQLLKYDQDVDTFITLKDLEQRLGDKAVPYMDKFVQQDKGLWLNSNMAANVITLINGANLSVEKLFRYIYKDAPEQQYLYSPSQIVNNLCDSYRMCEQLGFEFDKAPKALIRYHDVLAKEIKLCKDKDNDKAIEKVARKYGHLEQISEVDEEGEFKNKYSILIAQSATELVEEGKKMRHCVGSYVNKMMNEDCVILFVRVSKNIKLPFVTLEYNPRTNAIIQIKAQGNQRADSETLDFIRKWALNKQVRIVNIH